MTAMIVAVDVTLLSMVGVRYVALLLQHTRTTFSKMEYLEIFLNGKDISQEVSKLQGCFSQSV
jgi:hypothetical protein